MKDVLKDKGYPEEVLVLEGERGYVYDPDTGEFLGEISLQSVPEYSSLKMQKLIAKKKEKDQALAGFKRLCWIMALVLVGVLLVDVFVVSMVTGPRLSLVGMIVGLFLAPYVNRLRVLGMEFERLRISR